MPPWMWPYRLESLKASNSPVRASTSASQVPWTPLRVKDIRQTNRCSSIEPTAQPEEFRVTFDVGGRKAVYALTASSVVNPFRLPALHAFSCPERL